MNWFEPMDIYCERTDASFWAEPLNAWTNLSFIVAALVGLWLAVSMHRLTLANTVLIVLAASIGVGSFLFHTFANRWSDIADVVPIWTFVVIYVLISLRGFYHLTWPRALRSFVITIAAVGLAFYLMPSSVDSNASFLNGSEQYAPAIVALIIFGITLSVRKHPAASYIWAGLGIFIVSLAFRTFDNALCTALPFGTHFGWHIFNGLLIGTLLIAIIRHGVPPGREAADRTASLV
ncbi:MAG: ceramidase domain-containing protein [Hyphomicrobiaceae bacterium]|nr:ceramidase domain-containing protein [Hyphomicrobiaceae bacterium]MCC0024517.1 ceramidase domain-containing protein [Hyphomicrobiaceae bacterium]